MERRDASPQRYEAGNGLILSHFANLTTPEPKSAPSRWQRASMGANRAPAVLSGGPRSVPKPTGPPSVGKRFDDYVMDNQTESSDRSSEFSAGAEPEAARKSYAMSFSPPRHGVKSRRSENGDSAVISSSSGVRPAYRADETMEDAEMERVSPVPASVDFLMGRDPEEEDRAMSSKSDREKAFMYKKRYADTYEHAVALLKHAVTLEKERKDKLTDLEYLRSTIKTQTQIINTMSDNQHLNEPADYQQEKKIQALCREVTDLITQLGEKDSLIHSLHEERDRSKREIKKLKLSQQSFDSANYASQSSYDSSNGVGGLARSTDKSRDLKKKLQVAIEERLEALEREAKLMAQLKELQQVYQKCEAQRAALCDGLDQAEKQTTALHAQWVREKKDMMASVAKDDQKSAGLAVECEKLRKANESLKASLSQASVNEKKSKSAMMIHREAAEDAQARITQLESELNEIRSQVHTLKDKEERIRVLEKDISVAREKLRRSLLKVEELEEKLEQHKYESQAVKARLKERTQLLEQRVFDAEAVRRSLHNKVMELKGNIRVFCRVRPVLQHEFASSGDQEIFAFPDRRGERRQIELAANPKAHVGYGQSGARSVVKKYNFDFDLVFDSKCTQEDVFLEVSALVQSALDGYNVCIFAYGQTGSGKTYTMQGQEDDSDIMEPSQDMGIVGRSISHIFAGIRDLRSSGWEFKATLELIEIYNETLRDLLAPVGCTDKVELRLDSEGKVVVTNSFSHEVTNDQEAWILLRKAMSRRSTKSTNMNDRSSRSHCIITFRLSGINSLTGDERTGVINLVDLAGSERLSKSGSDSNRELMKEALSINKSLSALGNVICALAKKSAHVPFRDSKLTHVLSSSLGGDSKTLMICNLSPLGQHREETLNSLRFAKMVNSCEITYPSTVSSRS